MKKLSKILTSLSENGFLNLKNDKINSFNTLGLLVNDNLNNQLNKFLKQNDKFSYFLANELNDVKNIINRFSKLDSLINSFGLVYKTSKDLDNKLILKSNYLNKSNRCLALFCKQELSLNYFHWLQSKRHRFWRKLSTNPLNFQITNVNIDNNQNQNLNIIYKDDDLELELENITYFKTLKHLNTLNDNESNNDLINYWNNLDLILCETNVDLSTLSLLYNSFNENDNKSSMKLNEHLTPYQYSIIVVNNSKQLENRSKELINYIFSQSKSIDLNIYPFVDFNDKDNLIFDRNDSIGILYTIIIEEDELDKGFLSLRNRDTNLIEKFHITQLKSYLQLYAKGN